MKNLLLLPIIFTSLLFLSCKKERICTCFHTSSTTNGSFTTVSQSNTNAAGGVKIRGGSRKDAKRECEKFESNMNNQVKTSNMGNEVSCEIVD